MVHKKFNLMHVVLIILISLSLSVSMNCRSDNNKDSIDLNGAYIEQIGNVRLLHLYGSPYQRGYARGYLVGEEIMDLLQRYVFDYVLVEKSDLNYAQVCSLLKNNTEWPDSTIDELNGMLAGIHDKLPVSKRMVSIPLEGTRTVELIDLMAGVSVGDWSRISGCSGFVAWNAATGGPTIHARNLDYDSGNGIMLEHTMVIASTPDTGPQWVSIGTVAQMGGTLMNEYGLTMEGNSGGVGLPHSQEIDITPRAVLSSLAVQTFGNGGGVISSLLTYYRAHRVYVSQAALFSTPYDIAKSDNQMAAVFEIDNNDFNQGTTHRTPSEVSYSGINRTDVIIATNHFQKRIPSPTKPGDSVTRYNKIWQRIQVALNPNHSENPTNDTIIDAIDARWIMSGVAKTLTLWFVIFEPNDKKIHVSFSPSNGVPATNIVPTTLTWTQLFH